MNKVNFNELTSKLKTSDEIIILSTDTDGRYDEAVTILKTTAPTIKYIKVDKEYIDNYDSKIKEELFSKYKDLRNGKEDLEVLEKNFNNPNFFANLLVKNGYADGIVSGSTHPTSDILRPAFQIIKSRNKDQIISSFIWLNKENTPDIFMADISITPNPTAEELAQIAMQTANSVKDIFNIEPVVAMLSFSTLGSGGKNPIVLKVREATEIVKSNGIEVIGEIQFDAAYVKEIFEIKAKDSKLTNMPNVFVFPDLNSGNIGYKIGSILGGFNAIGPLLQNIDKPVNDLSRGANPKEIADLVLLTSLQVLNNKEKN